MNSGSACKKGSKGFQFPYSCIPPALTFILRWATNPVRPQEGPPAEHRHEQKHSGKEELGAEGHPQTHPQPRWAHYHQGNGHLPGKAVFWPLLHPRRLLGSSPREAVALSGGPSVWVLPSRLPCLVWAGRGASTTGSSVGALSAEKAGGQ